MDTWNAVLTTLARQFCQKGTDSSLGVQKRCGNLQFVLNKIVSSRKSCRHAECNVANADESFSSSWRWGTHGVQQCWIVRIFLSKRRFSENVSPDTHFQVSTNLPFFFSQSDKRFRSKSVMLESISFYCTFFKMLLWTHKMLLWWSRRKNFDKRKQNHPSNSKNYKTNYYFRKTIFLFQIALRTRKTQSCQAWWEIFAQTKRKALSNSEIFEKKYFFEHVSLKVFVRRHRMEPRQTCRRNFAKKLQIFLSESRNVQILHSESKNVREIGMFSEKNVPPKKASRPVESQVVNPEKNFSHREEKVSLFANVKINFGPISKKVSNITFSLKKTCSW